MTSQVPNATLIWLIVVLVSIAILVILIIVMLQRARRAASVPPEGGAHRAGSPLAPARVPSSAMLLSFSRALAFLKDHVVGRDYRYEVPWLLMMGPQSAGATAVLANAGGSAPLAREGGPTFGVPGGPEWWFYERGLVLGAPGSVVLRSDGRTSDQFGWHALLQSLVRRRPRRPLDGVILALSIEDVLDRNDSRATATDIAARAEILCQKLTDLSRAVSMRMPVYVLATKCDLIPGFGSFAGELPVELHDQIFGWSNPYPLEAAFSPDWVDQCCREMHDRILEQQMEIFVERNQLQEPDGVFLFPNEFLAIETALRRYLAFIFQPTAYHESYYFRGIYFCGDVAAPVATRQPGTMLAMAASAVVGGAPMVALDAPEVEVSAVPALAPPPALRMADSNVHRPAFLSHLFQRKILPEAFLARPLKVIDRSRNRTVLTAKILTAAFVVVAGIGTLVDSLRISALMHEHLGPLFQQLAADINTNDSQKVRMGQETAAEKNARLRRGTADSRSVLRSMALLSGSRMHSVFLPASWNRAADLDVQAGLAKAFGSIVLSGWRIELTLQLANLIKSTPASAAENPTGVVPDTNRASDSVRAPETYDAIARIPDYQSWERYIAGLKELEENIARYDRIATPGGGSTEDVQQLIKYLHLDSDLPPDFDFGNPYFQGMLRESSNQQFNFRVGDENAAGMAAAVQHAQALIARFFDQWFGPNNRLAVDVAGMSSSIDRFAVQGSAVSYEELKDIADQIERVSEDLESPDYAFLSDEDFDLARFPAFNQPINHLQYLQNLQFANEIEDHGRAGFHRFTTDLGRKSTRLTGQIVSLDVLPVEISSSVAALDANLRVLLQQVFVARDPGPARRLDPNLTIWDRNALLEAGKLMDAYNAYERGSLRAAPLTIREALQKVALERLQENAFSYIADAQSALPPGSPDGAEEQSFGQAAGVFEQLLTGFARFSNPTAANSFSTLLTGQATRMLAAMEMELTQDNLYAVRDSSFDWWQGEEPLSLAAYDVTSADELKGYVDRERDRVNSLAQAAVPLVNFVRGRSGSLTAPDKQMLTDWQAISGQLKNYADKTPGNSLLLLEDFIRTGLDKIAPDSSCQDATRDPNGRTDYFLSRRSSLRNGALARCRVLSRRVYSTQIAAGFNRRLANRFPFSATVPATPFEEADPAAIAEFFGKFDQYGKIASENVNQFVPAGKARDDALAFLTQLTAIRPVFAQFLASADKNPVPAFDLAVNFRVNREKEIEGSQISDWSFDVGSQNLQLRGKENSARWKVGDPVRLSLRFADDSPSIPVADKSQPAISVHQRIVSFDYTNAWSLFRMLEEHKPAAAEFERGVDPGPHTLSFYVPTIPDPSMPQRKNGAGANQVRVYLQIVVVPLGAKEGVPVPSPFPARAPELAEN
jgi:type VI secretion system protein ImpL